VVYLLRPLHCHVSAPGAIIKEIESVRSGFLYSLSNINAEDSKSKWKKGLRKYHPIGINLYSTDTSLYTRWNVDAIPCYILVDSSGKVLGKCISGPDDSMIDWVLYSATKGIHPVEAIWRWHAQESLRALHHSTSAFTDPEYAQWYERFLPALVEYLKWRREHQGF
jgi:hypothetical protein